ncbi:MAG: hypothetical protein KBS68_00715 [Clostridiales bacterium]|nr:hypothetical protein [Candidatus Crickella merdequi]
MKKAIVIYSSKRGSTKQYAEWIAEELSCEAVTYEESKNITLYDYDLIIYGGWIRGSGIVDFDNFQKRLVRELLDKMIVFGVGVARESVGNYQQIYDINYKKISRKGKNPTLYILSGRYDPAKITGLDGMLMSVMKKVLISGSTPDATSEAAIMKERLTNGCDMVERDNIRALVAEAKKFLA